MRIKKYEVADMKEALKLIKADLGDDAVILSTKKIVKNGHLGLFAKPMLEVTAAADVDEGSLESRPPVPPKLKNPIITAPAPAPAEEPPLRTKADVPWYAEEDDSPAPAATYSPRNMRTSKPVEAEPFVVPNLDAPKRAPKKQAKSLDDLLDELPSPAPAAPMPRPKSARPPVEDPQDKLAQAINTLGLGKFEKLMDEVLEIKKQLGEMQSAIAGNMVLDLPDSLRDYYNTLVKNGVDDVIAYRFMKKLEKRITDALSPSQVRGLVIQMLAELLPVEKNYFSTLHRKIIAFVGPTGVGKTTTIAKIAATLSLQMDKKVCLITIDNFRIGAVEQLRTYADIVDIPLFTASSPMELSNIISQTSGYDYVFLDSMGRSQFDSNQIDSILDFLNVSPNITVVLALSMASNHAEMSDTFERYSRLKPEYLLFTKLDETRYFGPLVNLPLKKRVPILMLANGQNVPDDMEIPDGKKIARRVLNEIPGLWSEG